MVKSIENATRKYIRGLLYAPFVPCPVCNKKTRAMYTNTCQWCNVEWNEEQLEERKRLRSEQIEISRKMGLLE